MHVEKFENRISFKPVQESVNRIANYILLLMNRIDKTDYATFALIHVYFDFKESLFSEFISIYLRTAKAKIRLRVRLQN